MDKGRDEAMDDSGNVEGEEEAAAMEEKDAKRSSKGRATKKRLWHDRDRRSGPVEDAAKACRRKWRGNQGVKTCSCHLGVTR